jgi:DNA-binding MarR family transcriptional regulator
MLYRAGEHTVSELENLFGITRSSVYRACSAWAA